MEVNSYDSCSSADQVLSFIAETPPQMGRGSKWAAPFLLERSKRFYDVII